MFARNLNAAQAYSNVGIVSNAMSANPHGLVLMLFEGATIAVTTARMHMQSSRTVDKAKAISKAVAIIQDGLMASLDRDNGGDVAENLYRLYEYMVERLVQANIENRADCLEEVGRLLAELDSAWQSIGVTAQKVGADG
ncbi:MAG: flagellar export chaperone FliS, partial [Betaproteobacteria bacterium]